MPLHRTTRRALGVLLVAGLTSCAQPAPKAVRVTPPPSTPPGMVAALPRSPQPRFALHEARSANFTETIPPDALARAAAGRRVEEAAFVIAVAHNEAVRVFSAAARSTPAHRSRALAAPAVPVAGSGSGTAAENVGSMPCGGSDYPPCYVAQRESGNTYGAYNPTGCGGSGCYGRWQFGGFWAGKLGLPVNIASATPAQQDEAARILWNHGAGCSNWDAC